MHEGHQDIAGDALREKQGKRKTAPRPKRDHKGAHTAHGHDGHAQEYRYDGTHGHDHDGHDHDQDHDDDHGHDHNQDRKHDHEQGHTGARAVTLHLPNWLFELGGRYRPFFMPLLLIVIALASWEGTVNEWFGFDTALIAVFIGLFVIAHQTLREVLRARRITAGVLVTIALVATVYVEHYIAGAVVAIMMLIGEALESLTLARTRDAISKLMDLTPPTARVVHDDHLHEVPAEDVVVGDVVVIYAGERLPVDGVIVEGHSALDQSPITGESLPVDRGPGDKVFSGSMNLSGPLHLRATAVGENSTVGKIIAVVRDAQTKKGPAQKVADRFAGWFTPLVLVVGLVTWGFSGDIIRAVTVLIIACPCALVLATPTAVVASVGNAARRGALIKGGVTVEKLAQVNTLVFDKTGTLTLGKPRVAAVQSFAGHDNNTVLNLAAMVEQGSRHPLAKAITEAAGNVLLGTADKVKELPGRGMIGEYAGSRLLIGTARLLEEHGVVLTNEHRQSASEHQANGWSAVWVARDEQVIGLIALGDTMRQGAKEMLSDLKQAGIHETVLLTGDNKGAARHVAEQLGITRVFAEVLPTDKSDVIATLQKEGKKVAMVGDGINDGPALAVSDVGIAMGAAGSDIAIDTADIALLGDRLQAIPEVLRLGRRTYSVIQQNIYLFALLANLGGMALASFGFLDPIMAAVVHNIASIFVVVNSSRLMGMK